MHCTVAMLRSELHTLIACPAVNGSDDCDALIERAIALKRAARGGCSERSLRGKHLGLICERPNSPDAELFQSAASRLGARVACIKPEVADALDAEELTHTAHLLGRLYDAVECQGLSGEYIGAIRSAAGIPVLDGLARDGGLVTQCEATVNRRTGDTDGRFYLLQAALLGIFD